jgi:hypothetical protein
MTSFGNVMTAARLDSETLNDGVKLRRWLWA